MLETCSESALTPASVHAALVGKGVAADVGLIGVGGQVADLGDEVGGFGQQLELLRA